MFGKKKEQDLTDQAAVQDDLQRLRALPIEQVAAEVMSRTFGPSGPAVDGEIRSDMIADGFLPPAIRKELYRLKDKPVSGRGFEEYWQLKALVREGVQVLEQKGLVLFVPSDFAPRQKYRATRLGADALKQEAVGRVIAGESI
jgi:hypothetical protein